jgi:glycosyltransferase involved in cell wall biosynthesis
VYRENKIIVVMPAYNAETTLRRTWEEVMAQGVVDRVIVVDDGSADQTAAIARTFPDTTVLRHDNNLGYGANQKSCYRLALEEGADIVVMVHPDYQYTPRLIPAMVAVIGSGLHPCAMGSRVLGGYALKGGMPLWRYIANRFLTAVGNLLMGSKLSELHSGYRAFSRKLLEELPLDANSDDFVFDNQMLAQVMWFGYTVAEISCPTSYCNEASSINFRRSVVYGLGCLRTGVQFRLARAGLLSSPLFPPA